MLQIAIAIAQVLFLIACVTFAYVTGAAPERRAAIWWGANVVVGTVFVALGFNSPTLQLIIDGICATGFLPLAVIYVSWWAGAVALLAATTFSLEAAYLLEDRKIDLIYGLTNNGITLATALVFLACGIVNLRDPRKGGFDADAPDFGAAARA